MLDSVTGEEGMVKKLTKNGIVLYVCEKCGLKYKNKKTAQECEEWCRKHNACNLKIIKRAVEF